MSYQLNDKIKNLKPYNPGTGNYKIRLDSNESPYNYPDDFLKEISKAIKSIDYNRYPDHNSTNLTNAFSKYYNIDPKTVTVGNGSDELIFIIESCFLEKGDKLLVVNPDFSMYTFYSHICEVEHESFNKPDDLSCDIDKLIERLNKGDISAVIFSNPCNPTAQGITKDKVIKLVSSVNCLVILDEAYMDFWTESLINKVKDFNNLIVLRTASKAMGSAAIRLGFAVSNYTITNGLKAVKSPYNVNSISQVVGELLYKSKKMLNLYRDNIVKNTKKLYNRLMGISKEHKNLYVFKTCTNFVFIKTDLSKELFDYLKENSILIRRFDEYLRITSGTEEENQILLKYIKDFYNKGE